MSKETIQEQTPPQVDEEVVEAPEEEVEEQAQVAETTEAEALVEAEAVAEEAKPKRKKKEDEIVEERFYTIPLQRALVRPPKKRAPRAMQLIKLFVAKHMKMDMKVTDEEEAEELPQLVVTREVNERVWDRGIEKPPRKIKTRITKDRDGNITVYLAENQ